MPCPSLVIPSAFIVSFNVKERVFKWVNLAIPWPISLAPSIPIAVLLPNSNYNEEILVSFYKEDPILTAPYSSILLSTIWIESSLKFSRFSKLSPIW